MINKKLSKKRISTKRWKSKKRKHVLRGGEGGDNETFKIASFNIYNQVNAIKNRELDKDIDLLFTQEDGLPNVNLQDTNFKEIKQCIKDGNQGESIRVYQRNNLNQNNTEPKCIITDPINKFGAVSRNAVIVNYKGLKIAGLHLEGGRYVDNNVLTDNFNKLLKYKLKLLNDVIDNGADIIVGDFNSVYSSNFQNIIDSSNINISSYNDDLQSALNGQYEYFKTKKSELNEQDKQKINGWNLEPYKVLIDKKYTFLPMEVNPKGNPLITNARGGTIIDTIWYKNDKVTPIGNAKIKSNFKKNETWDNTNYPDYSDHNPVIAKFKINTSEQKNSKNKSERSGDDVLFKPPDGSGNGDAKCWINSPLYSILFHPDIKKAITNYKGDDAIIKELNKFYGASYIWDNVSYVKLLTVMIDYYKDKDIGLNILITLIKNKVFAQISYNDKIKYTKEIINTLLQTNKIEEKYNITNQYSDSGIIIEILTKILKDTFKEGDKPKIPIDIITTAASNIDNIMHYINYLDSIIVSEKCVNRYDIVDIGHFYSYVKYENKWHYFDSGKYQKEITIDDIKSKLECNEDIEGVRAFTGIVINNPKLFETDGIFNEETETICNYNEKDHITFWKETEKIFYKKNGEKFNNTTVDDTIKNKPSFEVFEKYFEDLRCTHLRITNKDKADTMNNIWVNVDDIIKADTETNEGNATTSGEHIDGTMVCPKP
jgi:hypothetical protein